MKPVFIIVIAVVCSVAVVLGVLVGLSGIEDTQYREYQQQVQIQQEPIELFNEKICEKYGSNNIFKNTTYDDCMMFGYEWVFEFEKKACVEDATVPFSTNIEKRCMLQLDLRHLQAIKTLKIATVEDLEMIEETITIKFNQLVELQKEYKEKKEAREKAFDELADGNFEIDWDYEYQAIPVSEISEEYDNLKPEQYSQQYDFCLTENSEGFCQKQLNSVVNDYCYQKIMFYFDKVPQYNQILCVSKTTNEIVQNKPLTLENSDKIEQCKYDYRTRDDVNLISICLR